MLACKRDASAKHGAASATLTRPCAAVSPRTPLRRVLQELRPLVYPLVQVLVGAVRLLPSPRYFPLHLRLLRALVGLGTATRLLLPVSPLLLDMLCWAALHRGVRGSAGGGQPAQPQGVLLLRASKATLATAAFQQDFLEQVESSLAQSSEVP